MSEAKAYGHSFFVASGEVVAGFANFASLAILARILGADGFGLFSIAFAYVMALDFLLNFQSWRLVIRYGAVELANNDYSSLARILKLCSILDVASATVATLLGILLVPLVTTLIDGAEGHANAFYAFSLLILFNVVGQPTGLLRLYNKFLFLSVHKSLSAIARLMALAALGLMQGASLLDAVIAFVFVECVSKVILIAKGILEARKHGMGGFMRVPLRGTLDRHRDLVGFAVFSSLNDTVLKVAQQVDVFAVAVLLSPADAGFFRIVKSIGSMFSLAGSALAEVLYPEMAKLFTSSREKLNPFLRRLWLVLTAIAVVGFALYALIGRQLIEVFFGSEFDSAFAPSIVYVSGAALGVLMIPFTPMFLIRGAHKKLFVAYLVAALCYFAAIVVGAKEFGLVGAAASLPILYIVYFGVIQMFERNREKTEWE